MRQSIAFNVDINIDKRSIGLIKNHQRPDQYYLDFVYDAAKPCKIKIYVCSTQVRNANGQILYFFVPKELPQPSCYKFSKSLQQKFPKKAAMIDFAKYNQEQLTIHSDVFFPLVIVMVSLKINEETQEIDHQQSRQAFQLHPKQSPTLNQNTLKPKRKQKSVSLITYAEFKKQKNEYQIRVIKQKLIVKFVISNNQSSSHQFNNHVFDIYDIFDGESGVATEAQRKQCVVCFSRIQDTIVLPCRHLCLCHKCTQVVRVQTNKCPICRASILLLFLSNDPIRCNIVLTIQNLRD